MSLQRLASSEPFVHPSIDEEEFLKRCESAKELEAAGEHEAARVQLSDRWQRVGERPRLDGLSEMAQAQLLLRAGTLSGWIGSARQIEGAQEFAKDLISESARTFERLGLNENLADAQVDLAVCYWREGGLDEARVTLHEVLDRTAEQKIEPRLRALANLALLERVAGRYTVALQIQTQAAPLFNESNNHALRGNFHNVYAQVLKELGLAQHREDYVDRALVEFSAASYHFEQAGNLRFQASIENNLGTLFSSMGRYEDAHEHLDRARSLFVKLRDKGNIARVDESCARTLLAEGRNSEAANTVRNSVRVFEEGDERSALAESLVTQATALARINRIDDSKLSFKRAVDVAEQAGDSHVSGLAAIAFVEELAAFVSPADLRDSYHKAESLFPGSRDSGIQNRLGECARKILAAENRNAVATKAEVIHDPHQAPASTSESLSLNCSLEEEVLRYEETLIRRALESSGGSVTRAARLLGITHQGLAFILNGRHKSLLSVRKPVKPRRRSIIRYH
jgi:tetratricopeptide (TPR) repeat protein